MRKTYELAVILFLGILFFSCAKKSQVAVIEKPVAKKVKVALLCIGDENDRGYSYNFIQARNSVTKKLKEEGIDVEWVTKYNISGGSTCLKANTEAADEGCEIIINNSYDFEPYMLKIAEKYPEVEFISCTNQKSRTSKLSNVHNAFANIYEGRYVSGVVAGLKLNQMIEEREIRSTQAIIGYVAAYPLAEVISGFSAFFLGAKSVCPTVRMKVLFVNSWSNATLEADAAKRLADEGALIVSQHSDNYSSAVKAQESGIFHIGYNADMTKLAPSASLISTRIDWSVYFYEVIKGYVENKGIPKDWCKGMKDDAVVMTRLNNTIAAPETESVINNVIKDIKGNKLNVFDLSKFTIGGKVPSSKDLYDESAAGGEAVFDNVFHESHLQSAPYFTGKIDGIELVDF